MTIPVPTLEVELELARRCGPGRRIVVGLDEVGRGALAGPVAVGAVAIEIRDGVCSPLPDGVRDSKRLSPKRREALAAPIRESSAAHAIGWASAAEIDRVGIMDALAAAAIRALEGLGASGIGPDAILLDGDVDVVTPALAASGAVVPPVALRVGADRDCASVAAASILAKVARDALLVELDAQAPGYSWARNKGYGSAAHREAIGRLGPHREHRRSWNLGTGSTPGMKRAARETSDARSAALPSASAPSSAGVLWDDQWPLHHEEERR